MNPSRRLLAVASTAIVDSPQTISASQLPTPIRKYVQYHLRNRTPDEADPSLPQIAAPSCHASSSTAQQVGIPNPFLLQKLPRQVARVDGSISEINLYQNRFPKRQQKKLLEKYSPDHLPPSLLNPMSSPPKVVWNGEGEYFDAEITWEGDWAKSKAKGLYSGRKVMFKGHQRARERPEKQAVTKERVADMPRRVEEWRNVSGASRLG